MLVISPVDAIQITAHFSFVVGLPTGGDADSGANVCVSARVHAFRLYLSYFLMTQMLCDVPGFCDPQTKSIRRRRYILRSPKQQNVLRA
jgi:hypothetical protein